ncbi:PREDICTED: uncharacterized protein LOC108574805 [Habropoda laboriosa]|uniref:uncharacterized protein LOC108574805 n=1 Tax=Habropoda laboriosa TaxID=597456 RepID=UPI00083CC45B|nr:PREDICTED: uncharacterized protein LOC108574805 [Habropoda laboriosa]
MGAWMSWLILLQLWSSVLVHGYDNVGFDGWYQPVPHRPVDIITDVINDLGVRILQQYTAHGNVAFSPTGVGFVLAALYEGSAGRGRQQIADALGLPRDRDVTRIGFRDVHRRLRTYLNADGFLGGLTLNQENTKLRAEYEDILRFYGFNLSIPEEETDESTSTPLQETTEEATTEVRTPISEETTTMPTTTTVQSSETNEETMPTTMMVEMIGMTLNTIDAQDKLTQTTPGNGILVDDASTTSASITSTIPTATTTQPTTTPEISSSITSSTLSTTTTPSITITSTTQAATLAPAPTMMDAVPESTTPSSQTTESIEPPIPESTTTSTMTATIITTSSTISPINVTEAATTTSSMIPTQADEASTTVVSTNGPAAANENTVSTDSPNNQSIPTEIGSTDLPVTTTATGEIGSTGQLTTVGVMNRKKRSVRTPRGFFSSYPDEGIWMQDLGIWKPYSPSLNEASVRDSTEISFLVNGCDVSSVTASRYFAVLPFAYFPSLHAVALEFPLDDPRYNILLMMATDRRDTYRLARDLGGKSLRLLRKQLQATWVRATIPSFMLRGFVTLTSFLQRLGIVDVFEPRAADLSPMTPDLGVYARDVQQSIGVNIRNYMKPDRTHSRNGLFERAGPVPFTVVHPFLYFIVDAETSVVLIAGRVNDPLNSRIL